MFYSAIAAMLLMAGAPEEAQIDIGRINLGELPAAELKGADLPTPAMVGHVEQILGDGKCRISGQTNRRFDIDVPYAVLLHPDGSAKRVVVSDIGCPEIESLTGTVVLALARQREFATTGHQKPKWFGSTINFNLR